MKFETDADGFARAASAARSACGAQQRLVLINVDGASAIITGADDSLQIGYSLAIRNGEDGAVAVDSTDLSAIAKSLIKGGVVKVEEDEGFLRISCGRAKFSLQILSASGFPGQSTTESAQNAQEVDGALWSRSLILAVTVAASEQIPHEMLRGVHVGLEGSHIRISGTDGHRASSILLENEGDAFEENPMPEGGIVIPARAAREIARISADRPLVLHITSTHLYAEAGSEQVLTKLIDAAYPSIGALIAPRQETRIMVEKETLSAALNHIRSILDRVPIVKIESTVDGLRLSAQREGRNAEEIIPLDAVPEGVVFGINAGFLADALKGCVGSGVMLGISSSGDPVRVLEPGNDNVIHLIMTARV